MSPPRVAMLPAAPLTGEQGVERHNNSPRSAQSRFRLGGSLHLGKERAAGQVRGAEQGQSAIPGRPSETPADLFGHTVGFAGEKGREKVCVGRGWGAPGPGWSKGTFSEWVPKEGPPSVPEGLATTPGLGTICGKWLGCPQSAIRFRPLVVLHSQAHKNSPPPQAKLLSQSGPSAGKQENFPSPGSGGGVSCAPCWKVTALVPVLASFQLL